MASIGDIAAEISQSVTTEESAIRAGGEAVPVIQEGAGLIGAAILGLEDVLGRLVSAKSPFADAAVRSYAAAETANTATGELTAALTGSDVERGAAAIAAYTANREALTGMGNTANTFQEAIDEVNAAGEAFKERLQELSQQAEAVSSTANEALNAMPEATWLAIEVSGRL